MAVCIACSTNTDSVPTPANCTLSNEPLIEGILAGSEWALALEPGERLLIAASIDEEDQGAVEAKADTWYLVEGPEFILLGGTLPSRSTQAIVVLDGGTRLVLCPFGEDEPAVVGGVIASDSEPVDLEVRQGTSVISSAHLAEARRLSDGPAVAFTTTRPGQTGIATGVVRSPGVELTFEETSTTGP